MEAELAPVARTVAHTGEQRGDLFPGPGHLQIRVDLPTRMGSKLGGEASRASRAPDLLEIFLKELGLDMLGDEVDRDHVLGPPGDDDVSVLLGRLHELVVGGLDMDLCNHRCLRGGGFAACDVIQLFGAAPCIAPEPIPIRVRVRVGARLVLLQNPINGPTPLDNVSLEAPQEPNVTVKLDEDLEITQIADLRSRKKDEGQNVPGSGWPFSRGRSRYPPE